MITKVINYEDFNGEERTEKHYFHLTKSEVIKLLHEKEHDGNLLTYITKAARHRDTAKFLDLLEDMILRAYGEQSEDGRRFVKTDKLREEFKSSAAYDAMFNELLESETSSADFFRGILPKELQGDDNQPKIEGVDWNTIENLDLE